VDNPYKAPEAELKLEGTSGLLAAGDELPLDHWIPASTGLRFVGYLIDGAVMVAVVFAFSIVAGLGLELVGVLDAVSALPDQVLGFVMMVPVALIFGFLEGSGLQGSLGKKVLGMRVVTTMGGEIDLATAMKRNFAKWLGLGFCGFLAFTVLGGEGRSMWDHVAHTRVVKRNPYAGG